MEKQKFQNAFLLGLVFVASASFFWMVRSFLLTLMLAAVFTSLSYPLYRWFEKKTKNKKTLSSGLTLSVLVLGFIIPVIFFLGIVAGQAVKVSNSATPWIQKQLKNPDAVPDLIKKVPFHEKILPYRKEIVEKAGTIVSKMGKFMFEKLSAVTAGALIFILHFVIMLYAMFFFYIDGPGILKRILYLIPLENEDESRLLSNFKSMAAATIKGTFVIGLVQGFGAGLALWAAGIPSALFWSTLMAGLSIIPNVGSAIVWGPAVAFLFFEGAYVKGILVLAWCGIVVGSADNLLRPILIGKDTKMHELIILISAIGGIAMFGLLGILIGPLLACVFVTAWDIYGDRFSAVLPSSQNSK